LLLKIIDKMKKLIVSSALCLFSILAVAQQKPVTTQTQPAAPQQFLIKLTVDQLNAILQIIEDAPIPGQTRREISGVLRDQAIAQLPKQPGTTTQAPNSTTPAPVSKENNSKKEKDKD
jgi:hypothetical protein